MRQFITHAEIIRTEQLADTIFRTTIHAPDIAGSAKPGQFVMVRVGEGMDPLLRRPFSVHQATSSGMLQILFKVVGQGTKTLSERRAGDALDVFGPLGAGFSLSMGKVCLVGGGMGIAPLLFLATKICAEHKSPDIMILLGAQDKQELTVAEDFRRLTPNVYEATDNGSCGHHGLVTELMEEKLDNTVAWRDFSCGPYPMLKAVAGICEQRDWQCQVSLETVMACGMGACLGCAIPAKEDPKTYQHVCKHGPVFDAIDVAWR